MDRRTTDGVAASAGPGFYHPFARSVGGPVRAPAQTVAAGPAAVETPALRLEDIPTTGGFINPNAINPQARPSRL
ncbi:MAG TPA: hypothetical protein VGF29_13565 [Hyphomicrobiaceae bacterium]